MLSRRVKHVRLQTNVHIPGVGELGAVFPPQVKALNDLEMSTDESGHVNVKFSFMSIKKELLIPTGNIVFIELLPEDKKSK